MNNLRKDLLSLSFKNASIRLVQSNAKLLENCVEIRNRNPRNLESLTIARKPQGYHLDLPGKEYWNKLTITLTARHIIASVNHYKNGPIVSVSTQEWAMRKQLYKNKDVAAFTNLGRVLAQRCLESGISEVFCDIDTTNSKKMESLLEELKKGGITLEEPPAYIHPAPWDWKRPIKPWAID